MVFKKIIFQSRFVALHMTDVEKSEILHKWHVCDVGNVAIYAKFHVEKNWAQKYVCGEKKDIYEVCSEIILHPNYIRGKSSQANDIALVTVIKSSP